MNALLDVDGELLFERDGVQAMRIEAKGSLVSARIERAGTALELARAFHLLSRPARRSLVRAAQALTLADVALEVSLGARVVARLGAGARTGLLERWLGLDGVELHPARALLAALSG